MVIILSNDGKSLLRGEVVDVFTDSMRKIKIFSVKHGKGEWKGIDRTEFALKAQDKDDFLEEGGYFTLDEFANFIANN